jgi:hypothetical protein
MTVDAKVLAQLAAAAYRNVSDPNRITAPVALGWSEIATYPASGSSDDPTTGLSATACRGPGGQIVIAYCGTSIHRLATTGCSRTHRRQRAGTRRRWSRRRRSAVGCCDECLLAAGPNVWKGSICPLQRVRFRPSPISCRSMIGRPISSRTTRAM